MDNSYQAGTKEEEEARVDDSCVKTSEEGTSESDKVGGQPTPSVQTVTVKQTELNTRTCTSSSGRVTICSVSENTKETEEEPGGKTENSKDGMIPKDQRSMGGTGDDDTEPYSLIEFGDEKKVLLSKMGQQEFLFEIDHGADPRHHDQDELDEAAVLEEDSSDSSDLMESDSEDDEDDDVISIPLRGRCIQYLRQAICEEPCYHCMKNSGNTSTGKCKTIDAYSMDFKLKVLEWAYSKSIHSAGHHFKLERCVVRNWMMNEEKIFLLASSKGRRKWARYDSGKKDSTTRCSKANLDTRIVKGLGGLKVSGNGRS